MKKTIFITGSTDGIGKLAAIKLAQDGHIMYLHGRNPEKLSRVISEIKSLTGNDQIDGFTADLSDVTAVIQLAKTVGERLSKIDVLINNAGVYKSPVDHTNDQLDIRFAVNYFAPYLLTNALLPLSKQGTETRIINLSSAAQSTVTKGALIGVTKIPASDAYAQSKLALTMWSFYLAKAQPDVNVIAVNPGSLLNTNMVKEAYGHHWSSADKGATILYDLAVSDQYKNSTGLYFDNDKGTFGNAHKDAYDLEKIQTLLALTEDVLDAL